MSKLFPSNPVLPQHFQNIDQLGQLRLLGNTASFLQARKSARAAGGIIAATRTRKRMGLGSKKLPPLKFYADLTWIGKQKAMLRQAGEHREEIPSRAQSEEQSPGEPANQ